MTRIERHIWASAFATEFIRLTPVWDSTSVASCAGVADLCLEKFRGLIRSEDCVDITPYKEGEEWTAEDEE